MARVRRKWVAAGQSERPPGEAFDPDYIGASRDLAELAGRGHRLWSLVRFAACDCFSSACATLAQACLESIDVSHF